MEGKQGIGQLIGRMFGKRPQEIAAYAFTVELGDCPPLQMVAIPAGPFWMGSDKQSDPLAEDLELPKHQVHLDGYTLSKYPVTNVQYAVFVHSTGRHAPESWPRGRIPTGKEDYPVFGVSWYDAAAFCQWANVRLPTEAEWEKAARGTDERIYPWGNEPPDMTRCNFNGHERDTTPVAKYRKGTSPYGVMDMAGNVWEWVYDEYDAHYYRTSPAQNPTGPASGTAPHRVLRGGDWRLGGNWTRSAYRFHGHPTWGFPNHHGFRCARSL